MDLYNCLQNAALINLGGKSPDSIKNGNTQYSIENNSKETDAEFIYKILNASHQFRNYILSEVASTSSITNQFRQIKDCRFVVDSMLFGLGQKLRKCGFETKMIGDRNQLMEFCQNNSNYFVLSTGRAYRMLKQRFSNPQNLICLQLVTSNNISLPDSTLVIRLIEELQIYFTETDLKSRCVKCNRQDFWRIPRNLVRLMFSIFVEENRFDWIPSDLGALSEAERISVPDFYSNNDAFEEPEELYTLDLFDGQISAICREFTIDLKNRLWIKTDSLDCAMEITVDLSLTNCFKSSNFYHTKFYVCGGCGKTYWIH